MSCMNTEQKSLFWHNYNDGYDFMLPAVRQSRMVQIMPMQINTKRSIINFKWCKRFLMKKKHPNVVKNNQEGSRKMRQGRGSWTPRCMGEVVERLGLINQRFQTTCLISRCWCDTCLRKTNSAMFHVRMSHVKWTGHSAWTQPTSLKDKNLIAHRRVETLLAVGATNKRGTSDRVS
jgi:hypothetical protein